MKGSVRHLRIVEDELTEPQVIALIRLHLAELQHWSPPGTSYALPVERLREPDVAFFTAWDGDALASFGAIKHLDETHGEIKSMRAAPAYRNRSAGKAILLHLLDVARGRGYHRISLETGRTEPYLPARRLYESHGFAECPPFGDYTDDGFSLCMTREL